MNNRLAIASALLASAMLLVQAATPQATVRLSYGVAEGKAPTTFTIEDYNASLTQINGGDPVAVKVEWLGGHKVVVWIRDPRGIRSHDDGEGRELNAEFPVWRTHLCCGSTLYARIQIDGAHTGEPH